MRAIRVSENFLPVSEFKAQAAEWMRRIARTGLPLVVTQNGRPSAVVMSPAAFDALMERARFVSGVQEGLDDVDAGRVRGSAEVLKRTLSRVGGRRR